MAEFKKTMKKHIFLHPMDKKRKLLAVKSALLQDKNKYSDKLEGALLDVDNIKVLGDRYLIVDGYLSMEVIADFHVFSPQAGQTLEGMVNKRSKTHLGCLVLDTFNAALTIPFSSELDPQVGDSCTFVVKEVVIDGEILFLRGALTSVISKDTTTISDQEIMEDMPLEDIEASDIKELEDNGDMKSSYELHDVETSHDDSSSSKKAKDSPSKTKKKKKSMD